MPDISPNQGLSLPNATDNANGPLAFDNYNDGVEPRLIQRYLSSSDRSVRNPSPSQGEYSYLADRDEYDRYNGGWKAVRAVDRTVRLIVSRSTSTSIASGTFLPFGNVVNFETAVLNDYVTSMWNIANPSQVLLVEAGVYWCTFSATFASNATGQRGVRVSPLSGVSTIIGGTLVMDATATGGGAATTINGNAMIYTTGTSGIIEMFVAQNSGGNLNVTNQLLGITRVG